MGTRSHESKGVKYSVTLKGTPSITSTDVAWELYAVSRETESGEQEVKLPAAEKMIRGSEDAAFERVFDLIDELD